MSRASRKRVPARPLIAILFIASLCWALPLHAAAATFEQIRWKYSTGFDYSEGDYGLEERTELIYVPLSLQATLDRVRARVMLPFLSLDGPTGVLPGGTVIGGSDLEVSNPSGLGQLVATGSYLFGSPGNALPYLEVTGKLTAPTETNDALGTGVWAFALQFDVFERFGRIAPFASVGRKFYEGSRLDDRFYTSLGASVEISDAFSLGCAYDWLEATTDNVGDVHQLSPFVSLRLGESLSIGPYAVVGLSRDAGDVGGGFSLSLRR